MTKRQEELIDALVKEASSNNEYDNRRALAEARAALEAEIDRLNSLATKAKP
jgi:hypothetical protein